ncbi:ATP-binding protein [Jeotgalibacillus salarius]|uniref:ATP-binding protein n=1 Tax=Jeotgalibacillus salarius TaxID=546023 RepID=A0A4Y8LIG3_9BACL|nr:ATP-binding protein [Jeotgalibacillus salarius]TFE01481.1 ATP-binding protein [Jeotgalibacillus salarius]
MNKKWIGHITKVFFNKMVFEVPDLENLRHNYLGDFYIGRGLNDYITIFNEMDKRYIFQVIGLYENEKPYLAEEESKFKEKAYFEAIPIGEITTNGFEYGLASFPMINEDVFLTSTEDLEKIFHSDSEALTIALGELSTNDYLPKININKLLTNHLSVLGNTGSGKSTTIRKLLSELLELRERVVDINQMNFLIFDIHNEYQIFPNEYSNQLSIDEISIPTETITTEDWINLIQPSSAAQLPILMNGLRMASLLKDGSSHSSWIRAYSALELYNNQQTDAVTKRAKIIGLLEKVPSEEIARAISSYSAQYGNFSNEAEKQFKQKIRDYVLQCSGYQYDECQEQLIRLLTEEEVEIQSINDLWIGIELVILLEEAKGNAQIRSYCSTLITRIENIIYTYSKTLFDQSDSKKQKFEEFVEFKKGFTVIDCSTMEDTDLLFFTGYMLKEVFNRQKSIRNEKSHVDSVFHFILDEAHRYLSEANTEDSLKSLKIFERISKEGRKFGLFLILASQRPGELSKTVLSQCNNFILHRIRNNIDLEQMRKSIPYINDMQLFRLSYLRTGTVLTVGEAFSIPMELNIHGETFGVYSETVDLNKLWSKH